MKEVVAKSKQMKVYVDTILVQRSHRVLKQLWMIWFQYERLNERQKAEELMDTLDSEWTNVRELMSQNVRELPYL